jgi:hypothetical protein
LKRTGSPTPIRPAVPLKLHDGHVDEIRDDALGSLFGHALRRGYATLALEADVPVAELRSLLKHAISGGGVAMGYLYPSLENLRSWQERATARILSAIGLKPSPVAIY